MLCALIYMYVNAKGLTEMEKRRENGGGFAFLQDPYRVERGMPTTWRSEGWRPTPPSAAPAQPAMLLPS